MSIVDTNPFMLPVVRRVSLSFTDNLLKKINLTHLRSDGKFECEMHLGISRIYPHPLNPSFCALFYPAFFFFNAWGRFQFLSLFNESIKSS